MELVVDKWNDFQEFYQGCLEKADKRVENWLLMGSYTPTLVMTLLYLVTVKLGMEFMKTREAFKLKYTLFIYNMGLVLLNFHIFFELITATTRRNYSYACQPVDYSDNPDEIRIAKALWWYYFSKCIEFLDTIFFVLRKKNNQVSFLHVYHHATMFPIWWIGVKWVPGGQSFFGAMINSFIHVIMYTYYGISVLGPEFQKYLWWKRYLTKIQLIQFLAGMFHAAQSLFVRCEYPVWMQWALIFYGLSILSLFLNFYFHAYIHPKKTKKPAESSNGTAKNGHIQQNGDAKTNGHVERKKTK